MLIMIIIAVVVKHYIYNFKNNYYFNIILIILTNCLCFIKSIFKLIVTSKPNFDENSSSTTDIYTNIFSIILLISLVGIFYLNN